VRLTHFFILLFVLSFSLFVLLKPQAYSKSADGQVPQLEIEDFTLYKLDEEGVQSVVSGTIGRQYVSYYEVQNAHYIENKNKLGQHLYSDKGRFEKDIAYLDDNVRYFREDGLSFESDHAVYDTKKEFLYVPKKFILTQNENVVYGKELHYNSITGEVLAQDVDANYYMEERK
jgi:LPS export ABC transporter protein LptC